MHTIKLKGITWDHPRGYDPLVAASELYFEKNKVAVTWEKRTLKDFGDQSLDELAKRFDLLIVDHPHSGALVSKQSVLSLNEFMPSYDFELLKSQSAGPSFESYNYQGKQRALPVDAAIQCAAYREDLMQSAIPETWEEVIKMERLGLALCPTDSVCTFLTINAQLGSPVIENNKQMVNEETGTRAIELMKALQKIAHPDSLDWNPIQLFDYMAEHSDVAYTPLAFCYTNYSRLAYRKNRLIFTHAPGKANTILGGAGIAVSSNCENKNNAVQFAIWLCSEAIQKGVYVTNQGQSANIKAWEDVHANLLTNSFFLNLLASLEGAYLRPRFKEWPKFQEYMGNIIHECLKKKTDSLKTIKHLNEEFGKIRP